MTHTLLQVDRSIQIMGGSFRRGLNSEVVTLSTRLAVQPSPLYKSNGRKARWQPPISVSSRLIGPKGSTPLFMYSSLVCVLVYVYNTMFIIQISAYIFVINLLMLFYISYQFMISIINICDQEFERGAP